MSGDDALVMMRQGNSREQLTAIDLRSGEAGAAGTCDATPCHDTNSRLYGYDNGLSVLRLTP